MTDQNRTVPTLREQALYDLLLARQHLPLPQRPPGHEDVGSCPELASGEPLDQQRDTCCAACWALRLLGFEGEPHTEDPSDWEDPDAIEATQDDAEALAREWLMLRGVEVSP